MSRIGLICTIKNRGLFCAILEQPRYLDNNLYDIVIHNIGVVKFDVTEITNCNN